MARELNRELFGTPHPMQEAEGTGRGVPAGTGAVTYPQAAPVKPEEVRVIQLHLETMSRRMKDFESRVEVMHTKVEEVVAQNRQRFERVQGHFQRQNEMLQNSLGDVHSKIAQVVSRMNERKINENMVKEMVDRHGAVVQAFEVRLQQMQKVMSDQELQLMHARSELKQALFELSRLKKM